MLRELHISNLAVIADARVELHKALNCFTGATGAGKSLVIGAIEVLLALRSPAEMLRPGAPEGRISGVFEIHDPALRRQLEKLADTTLDGDELLLTRRIYSSGRSSVSLNGQPITLAMLKGVAECLVDVHGQHDHQFLLRPSNQLDVLDQFADLGDLRRRYHGAFTQLSETRRRLAELSTGGELRRQQLDLHRFQAGEIDAAELQAGEHEELQARVRLLKNLEKLQRNSASAHDALYESEGSILERLKMVVSILAESAELDEALTPTVSALREATIQLEESAFDLGRYINKLELDPAELGEAESRLNTINRILDKYGQSVEEVIAYRAEIGAKIAALEGDGGDLTSLSSALEPLAKDVATLGAELTRKRKTAAAKLLPLIHAQLGELGMEKARFEVQFAPAENALPPSPLPSEPALAASPAGLDAIEFLAQTNPGQLPQPLRKIASGGELSRIMLALKGILAQSDRVSVLVFDEIDSNVGGRLGAIIGSKLRDLARHHQVLCITHLPQIAAYADRHLTVRKEVAGRETLTTVREMSGDDRVSELAEMISGHHVTATTLAQVKELLAAAQAPAPAAAAKPSSRARAKRG
jgi:DNA repair protein RecN (Recombination protein N)